MSLIIAGYTVETEIPTNIPQYIRIPQFDKSNKTHLKIAELSKLVHSLARMNQEADLKNIEQEIDELSC